ncbi:MAG TPA: class I SAM-dependent methyltransferase [Anaerolineae bacterium]|nr:class I SAM-dependent methyltransferase [Anaerolineae bacterium]
MEKRRFCLISRLIPTHGVSRILDMGCGSGWLSEMLHNRGLCVIALDLGFDSIKRASARAQAKRVDIPFVQGDMYRLPLRESTFDAVVVSEVLEHLENPQDALDEIAKILRPGGYIIVSTPYRERIQTTLCIHCNRKTPVNAHLHMFDETILKDMLSKGGFTIQKYIKFVNRQAEYFGMAGFTFFLPYIGWRLIDAIACRLLGRESFIVVRAVRSD